MLAHVYHMALTTPACMQVRAFGAYVHVRTYKRACECDMRAHARIRHDMQAHVRMCEHVLAHIRTCAMGRKRTQAQSCES